MAHKENDSKNAGAAEGESLRLDKWLWAARFYKTRAIASDAVDGGKVHLNGDRVKRSKGIRIGDVVQLRAGPFEQRVVVRAISERRGPATVAAELYEELPESVLAREAMAAQRRLESFPGSEDVGRPSKRERRQIDDFRKRD
ncbi:MAG: RNA-binding S4 domain-containing protein [Gemmatimonadaceae bacterium]